MTIIQELPNASDLLVIDLFRDPRLDGGLRLSGNGRPVSAGDAPSVLARLYRVHLFDMTVEAEASAKSVSLSMPPGFLEVETARTEEGHGVMMTAQSPDATHSPPAGVALVDHRASSSFEECRAVLSIDVGRRAAAEARSRRALRRLVSMERRGRLLGDLVRDAAGGGVAIRSCQRSIAEDVAADVPVDWICVEDVKDRIEEILEGMEAEVQLPSDLTISTSIRRAILRRPSLRSGLVDEIAWSLVWGNKVDFL
jgi:hypothetical protein